MLIAADPSTMLRSKSMRPGHRSNMGERPGAWNSRDAELHRNAPRVPTRPEARLQPGERGQFHPGQ
jgi:hypothetical protein